MFTAYDRARLGCSNNYCPRLQMAHRVVANRGAMGIKLDYLDWAAQERRRGNLALAKANLMAGRNYRLTGETY